ncbi:CRISPR-associated protein Csx11 [Brockia lithotrophica]|uniref:CRISPR-associated protein Csx11 n=1 Tax=Brockia lithotrophica TaxID=933949 RepID=A0A660L080_9BACL|nr:CRISPR-associated protein Csx11 [Brockia lithotrophica]RKQ84650.1 hypothetical protein C7438_1139 [Brockia lithotrophica]
MTDSLSPAEILRNCRPLLLAMEAIGWFHMAGKAREEFLRKHGGENNKYDYKKWHEQENTSFTWDKLLGWVRQRCSHIIPEDAWPRSFADFTEKHTKASPGLLGLLQAAHGITSGVEKNLPTQTSNYLRQTIPHMWLSSPWGHPKRNLLADPPEILSPQGWEQLVREIRRVLEELQKLVTDKGSDDDWLKWRNSAIGEGSFIRRAFLSTLAETRLPDNDVTLWDQSYVAAALFKSAVAGELLKTLYQIYPDIKLNFLDENNIKKIAQKLSLKLPNKDSDKKAYINAFIKNNTRWRLLTVALGTEHYEARAVKIGDWTGAKSDIEDFFRQVAALVEVDLAVGSLLYRDNTVAVFSLPGERFDEEELERQRLNDSSFKYDDRIFAPWLKSLNTLLREQVDKFAYDLNLETPPYVRLSSPTRSLVPMVREWREARKTVAVPIHKPWDICHRVPTEAQGHVCPVCQVRLNGDRTNKGKPCEVCRERRHHRRDDWIFGQLGNDTIWFEEVADSNDRLALLTFSLDLEDWLNGERVDSLRAQAIPEWARFNPVFQEGESKRISNPISPQTLFSQIVGLIKEKILDKSGNWKFVDDDIFLNNLHDGFKHFRKSNLQRKNDDNNSYEKHLWRTFYEQIVEDRADAPSWDELNDDKRISWLAHQLFRKLPSPGRVYRFWRESEEFFHDLLREFRQLAARSDNPWRVRRLLLVPDNHDEWRDLTLYNGRWQGRQISLIYVKELGGFVTAFNLARWLRPEDSQTDLQGVRISLEVEDAPEGRREMTVKQVRGSWQPFAHLSVYHPVIPVELSPLRFRVLVPLEVASECVDLAVAQWQKRFARVWDRLPLRVGVVAFPRMVPYQAIVEAVRNVEDGLASGEETWMVVETRQMAGVVTLRMRRRRVDDREVLRDVPVVLPDGREDVFYPYVAVKDSQVRFPRDFQHPYGKVYRHVADLLPGDDIQVVPARVNTLFMDSTAARFNITPPRYLEDWTQMRQIWALLQRVAPSQTALQSLRSELARLEEEWKAPPEKKLAASPDLWRETLKAFLAHHLEVHGTELEALTEAAVQGILRWTLDWHIAVLKERL